MFCKKHGLKRVERANMNGTKHVYIAVCPQESSRLESNLCLHPKSFCFKRFWNSSPLLFNVMNDNNHRHFKAMCQVNKFGYIAQVVANILGHVVQQCVLNQNQGYWLLYDGLIMSLVCQTGAECCTPYSRKLKILMMNFKFHDNPC
jgi:hypothetical protein